MIFRRLPALTGPTLIALAAVLWAFDGIVRRSLFSLPPLAIVFFEHLTGVVFLLPVILTTRWRSVRKIVSPLLFVTVFSGLLGTLWFTSALLAVQFIPFSVVFLLQKLQPIFAVGSAKLFLQESFSKRYVFFATLALCAAYFVTFPNGRVSWDVPGSAIAALYALGAAFGWGVSTTFSKKIVAVLPSQQATGLRFLATTLLAGIVLLATGKIDSTPLPTIDQWMRFVFIAVSTGMGALLVYYHGLKKTPVRVATIMELLFPLLAVCIDAVVYKASLLPTQYLAAGILLYAASRVAQTGEDGKQITQG